GEAFDLVGDLEELRVLVLWNAIGTHGGNGNQFAQGFSGRRAVLHPRVQPQQTMDFVLLLGRQRFVVQEAVDGRRQGVGFSDIALGKTAEELPEVFDRCIVERRENGRALLGREVGRCRSSERRKADQNHCGRSQFFE
nr:hypothetical protein [Tanacetum cinerariifolium]